MFFIENAGSNFSDPIHLDVVVLYMYLSLYII